MNVSRFIGQCLKFNSSLSPSPAAPPLRTAGPPLLVGTKIFDRRASHGFRRRGLSSWAPRALLLGAGGGGALLRRQLRGKRVRVPALRGRLPLPLRPQRRRRRRQQGDRQSRSWSAARRRRASVLRPGRPADAPTARRPPQRRRGQGRLPRRRPRLPPRPSARKRPAAGGEDAALRRGDRRAPTAAEVSGGELRRLTPQPVSSSGHNGGSGLPGFRRQVRWAAHAEAAAGPSSQSPCSVAGDRRLASPVSGRLPLTTFCCRYTLAKLIGATIHLTAYGHEIDCLPLQGICVVFWVILFKEQLF